MTCPVRAAADEPWRIRGKLAGGRPRQHDAARLGFPPNSAEGTYVNPEALLCRGADISLSPMSGVSRWSRTIAGPIVVADEVRDRRLFLEHALRSTGYGCLSASCGAKALRLTREERAPLLVTHVGVRCGDVPLAFAIRRQRVSIGHTRVLAFTRRRGRARSSIRHRHWCDAIVYCTGDPAPVLGAVERLVGPARQRDTGEPDLLVELMLLDEALGNLPEWWLPGWSR